MDVMDDKNIPTCFVNNPPTLVALQTMNVDQLVDMTFS